MTRNPHAIFADIDSMNPQAFTDHLTERVRFRLGNGDPVFGPEAVDAALGGFLSTIAGMRHHFLRIWDVDANTSVVSLVVEYTRLDGEHVFTPTIDVLVWDGDKVSDWQIVIDVSPIYSPIEQIPTAARSLQAA